MKTTRILTLTVGAIALAIAGPAAAETWQHADDEELLIPSGSSIMVGGGFTDFTDGDMRDTVEMGGSYEARAAIGTRTLLGFEAAYVGSVQSMDTPGVNEDARLYGNGAEGNLRLNFGGFDVQPYVLGGVGFMRYDLSNVDFNTSNVRDSDTVMTFPVGGGVGYQIDRWIIDARGVVRPAVDEDLVVGDDTRLATWSAQARVGFEF